MSAANELSRVTTAVNHAEPIAPVTFGVTLILIAALEERRLARRTHQPSVRGKLLMGLLLSNVLAWSGYELMLVLREHTAVMDMTDAALSGLDRPAAATLALGAEAAPACLEILHGPRGGEYPWVPKKGAY
jgi:hypothetical protein